MKYIRAGDLKIGDYIINLGKIEKLEKFDHSIDNQPCINITITHGICFSAAFFWYKASQMIAINN